MARAVTAKYEEMVLEVEFTPDSGTFDTVCGLTDVTINRTSNIDTSEIPDCDDESLPLSIERQVRSQEVSVSATGVWALSSNPAILEWWYSGATLNTRIRHAKADADGAVGDPIAESGPALLVNVNHTRTKGKKVANEIEIQFDGVPAVTDKA